MIRVWLKPRCGFGIEKLYKELNDIEWTYEIIPHLKDIDHKQYAIKISDENNKNVFDEYCTEFCPCCDSEVTIPSFGVSFCPNCGKVILPCSMCNLELYSCTACPYVYDERK